MEQEPNFNPDHDALMGRINEGINQYIAELGDPRDATIEQRAAIANQAMSEFVTALDDGIDITPVAGRFIAYFIVAEASEGTATDALTHYFRSGEGSHQELQAEYLMHYFDPRTTNEERLLVDVLGTHLFRQEHTEPVEPSPPWGFDVALLRTSVEPGAVDALFQLPGDIAMRDVQPVLNEIQHHIEVKGDAFKAFLRLPGIEVTSDNLISHFNLAYRGCSADEDFWTKTLPSLKRGAQYGMQWDGIEIGGATYVFAR